LTKLADGSAFSAHTSGSSDTSVLTVTNQNGAVGGSYKIDVTQLATSLKASSGAFADSSAKVGTGTLNIAVGSQQMSLTLDSTNNSLAQIRDAINKASDNPGVSATLVTGSDGTHLVLSGTHTGAGNGFVVSSSGGDGGLAALNYDASASSGNALSVITPAQDALYSIDGLAANSASNSVGTAIDGLTLNLVATGTSTVSVSNDSSVATSAINNLVSTYNSFVGIYGNLTRYDATTGTAGALIGDATLNSIKSTLANIVGGTANGSTLNSIGVSLQVDGTLQVDSSKLSSALSDGGATVKALFTGANGFATKLNAPLDGWIGSQGILGTRTDNLNKQLTDLGNSQTALDNRMDALTTRYTRQFSALDAMLTKLNNTSSYLTQQFDALNNSKK
jgi:flagellar hook-associated protein 2